MARSKTYQMLMKISGDSSSLKKACEAASEHLNTLGNAAKAAGKVLATAMAGIGTAAGIAVAVTSVYTEHEKAANSLAAATGATGKELENLQSAMETVYQNNFGESIEDAASAVSLVSRNIKGLSNQEIAGATEAAIALRDAFEYDVEESTRAAAAIRKNFGGSAEEAFGLIAAGAQNGLDYSGELIDTINEYSSQFSKLGFSADGMFQLLQSGADGTAWNLDKVGDAVKEFSIRAIDGSNTTVAAFEALGYNAATMMDTFAAGGDGANQAFFDVLNTLMDMEDQVARDALGVSLFGTMWEDLGTEAMEAMANASAGAYDTMDALEQINAIKYNDLDSAMEGVKRQAEAVLVRIGEQLAPYAKEGLEYLANNVLPVVSSKLEEIVPVVIDAGKALWENRGTILALGSAVVTAVGAFKGLQVATAAVGAVKNLSTIFKAAAQGGGLLNKVMSMGNVKLALIAGVIAVVAAGFVLLWNKSEKFRETVMVLWGQLQALGGALADMAGAIWAKAAPLLEMLGNALLNGLERAVDLLAPVAGNILGIFTGIADFISGVFSGDWSQALRGLQTIFGNALSGLGNLAVAGFTTILEIGTSIWPTIDSAVQAGITAISSRFPVLGAVLASLWSTTQKVWSNIQVILQNAIQFVQNVFSGNWSAAWQNIVNIFGSIFSTVASIAMAPLNMLASGVQSAINSVAAFLQEKFPFLGALFSGWASSISAAIENIKAIFSGIISFIENVFAGNWSSAWQNIVDIFGNLFGMIVNLAKAPINGVISAINFVLEKINGISVTIPDWVPGVGGTTLGFNIPTIPQLATGGIVTAPTILEAGEGGEAEAILPLSKLAAMLQSVANAPEIPQMESGEKATAATAEITAITMIPPQLVNMLEAWADRVPEAPGLTIPEIPDLGNREDSPEEAPLAQLAKMLDDWTRNNKPDPHGPGQGGGGGWDFPEPQPTGANGAPPPAGGQNPPGGGVDTITFAPVFNFYGGVTKEEAVEAGKVSFAEFKRLYNQLKAEERRKNLSASTR